MQKTQKSTFTIDTTIKYAFWAMMSYRFLLPFYYNPIQRIFSDPGRHWKNGLAFLHPYLMGSIDPKGYQLYIWLLQQISGENHLAIALLTGLLSVSMAYVWWGVCRELFSPRKADIMGLVIGFMPSLTGIYTLFMNETLLLVLEGAALYFSLKAIRTERNSNVLWAMLFWIYACFTRPIALPFMALTLTYVFYKLHRNRFQNLTIGAMIFMVFAIPASWLSYTNLHIIAPFGFMDFNKFYYYSNTAIFEVYTDKGRYGFKSPSIDSQPLAPLAWFTTCRSKTTAKANIDLNLGMKDWKTHIDKAKENFTMDNRICAHIEDAIYLLFGPSWPDSTKDPNYNIIYYLNYLSRWMWFPLIFLILPQAAIIKSSPKEMLILLCALTGVGLMLLQETGVTEGRYRKPLEPLIIISCAIIIRRKQEAEEISLWKFGTQTYISPLTCYVKNTLTHAMQWVVSRN